MSVCQIKFNQLKNFKHHTLMLLLTIYLKNSADLWWMNILKYQSRIVEIFMDNQSLKIMIMMNFSFLRSSYKYQWTTCWNSQFIIKSCRLDFCYQITRSVNFLLIKSIQLSQSNFLIKENLLRMTRNFIHRHLKNLRVNFFLERGYSPDWLNSIAKMSLNRIRLEFQNKT